MLGDMRVFSFFVDAGDRANALGLCKFANSGSLSLAGRRLFNRTIIIYYFRATICFDKERELYAREIYERSNQASPKEFFAR